MSHLHLNTRVLKSLAWPEALSGLARYFSVPVGDETYTLSVVRQENKGTHTTPPEPAGPPDDDEVGDVVAKLVRMMMAPEGGTSNSERPTANVEEESIAQWLGRQMAAFPWGVRPDARRSHFSPPPGAKVMFAGAQVEPMEGRRFLVKDVSEREEGPGPDFGAGWEEYRRQLLAKAGCKLPGWEELPKEVQECWCAGVAEVIEGLEILTAGGGQ